MWYLKKKKVMTKLLLLMYKSGLIYRVYMKEPEENKDTALMKAKQPETSDERETRYSEEESPLF